MLKWFKRDKDKDKEQAQQHTETTPPEEKIEPEAKGGAEDDIFELDLDPLEASDAVLSLSSEDLAELLYEDEPAFELPDEVPGETGEAPAEVEPVPAAEPVSEPVVESPKDIPVEPPEEAAEVPETADAAEEEPPEEIFIEIPEAEQVPEAAPVVEEAPPEPLVETPAETKKGFLARLKDRLAETRAVLNTRVDHLLLGIKEIDEDILEELEEILITSDLGVKTTQTLMKVIEERIARKELTSGDRVKAILREEIGAILSAPKAEMPSARPHVILVVGVNGVGKTTTIAKLAHRYITEGKKVLVVAGDTFRAAAVEQLTIWSERVGADIIKQKTGSDPSAVVFDAMHAATARDVDIVLIDTAGRLHTKVNLMEELKKINRVADRELPGAPHEVLLVLDATTGQNAVNQAKQFNEAVNVSHVAMTKLDGSAKGGVLVAICHELGLPIRYIGLGEKMEDLRDFDADAFVEALFAGENH